MALAGDIPSRTVARSRQSKYSLPTHRTLLHGFIEHGKTGVVGITFLLKMLLQNVRLFNYESDVGFLPTRGVTSPAYTLGEALNIGSAIGAVGLISGVLLKARVMPVYTSHRKDIEKLIGF